MMSRSKRKPSESSSTPDRGGILGGLGKVPKGVRNVVFGAAGLLTVATLPGCDDEQKPTIAAPMDEGGESSGSGGSTTGEVPGSGSDGMDPTTGGMEGTTTASSGEPETSTDDDGDTDEGASTTEGGNETEQQPFEMLNINPPVCADVDPGECGVSSTNQFSIQYQGDMPMIEDPENPGQFIPDIQTVFSHDPPELEVTPGTVQVISWGDGQCILEYTATNTYGNDEYPFQESVDFTIGGQHHDGFSFFIVNPALG